MKKLIVVACVLSLGGCASKSSYIASCTTATFTSTQCAWLWSKRNVTLGVSSPIMNSAVGFFIP